MEFNNFIFIQFMAFNNYQMVKVCARCSTYSRVNFPKPICMREQHLVSHSLSKPSCENTCTGFRSQKTHLSQFNDSHVYIYEYLEAYISIVRECVRKKPAFAQQILISTHTHVPGQQEALGTCGHVCLRVRHRGITHAIATHASHIEGVARCGWVRLASNPISHIYNTQPSLSRRERDNTICAKTSVRKSQIWD